MKNKITDYIQMIKESKTLRIAVPSAAGIILAVVVVVCVALSGLHQGKDSSEMKKIVVQNGNIGVDKQLIDSSDSEEEHNGNAEEDNLNSNEDNIGGNGNTEHNSNKSGKKSNEKIQEITPQFLMPTAIPTVNSNVNGNGNTQTDNNAQSDNQDHSIQYESDSKTLIVAPEPKSDPDPIINVDPTIETYDENKEGEDWKAGDLD